jgi:hypothetical protein
MAEQANPRIYGKDERTRGLPVNGSVKHYRTYGKYRKVRGYPVGADDVVDKEESKVDEIYITEGVEEVKPPEPVVIEEANPSEPVVIEEVKVPESVAVEVVEEVKASEVVEDVKPSEPVAVEVAEEVVKAETTSKKRKK